MNHWMHLKKLQPEIAVDLRPFQFPCPVIAVYIPDGHKIKNSCLHKIVEASYI